MQDGVGRMSGDDVRSSVGRVLSGMSSKLDFEYTSCGYVVVSDMRGNGSS